MSILELADFGDFQLAYATLRLVTSQLDCVVNTNAVVSPETIPKSSTFSNSVWQPCSALRFSNKPGLPKDYYGDGGVSKQERRDELGQLLMDTIPQTPSNRLPALIQQAIKWQAHTGQLPMMKQYWSEENGAEPSSKTKRRKKRKFDLVLGESVVASATGKSMTSTNDSDEHLFESIPSKVYSTLSFGKRATAEAAVFLPDGSGLVTGSSDGLVEIWSSTSRYTKLREDLPYQQTEELIGHDDTVITAVTISNDGAILATGDANGLVVKFGILATGGVFETWQRIPISDLLY
jgi:WD40 repeat-containing protein SMU1